MLEGLKGLENSRVWDQKNPMFDLQERGFYLHWWKQERGGRELDFLPVFALGVVLADM